MNIAVYHNLPAGGGKRALFEEIKYLAIRNNVDLYILDPNEEYFLDTQKLANKVYKYKFEINNKSSSSFVNRIKKDLKIFYLLNNIHRGIAKDINSRNYDVCLIHPDKYTQAPYLIKHLKLPTLYFCEEYLRIAYEKELQDLSGVRLHKRLYESFTRVVRKHIDKVNAQSATKVLANSKFTKRNIDKAFNINSEVCHLGVNPQVFKRYKVPNKGNKYVLLIGDRTKIEGSELISEIENDLKIAAVKIKIKNLGFDKKNNISINNDHTMAKLYSGAVAALCTASNEPFGIAPLESMACMTPVLAVEEGGYKETVKDGVTGYLLERNAKIFVQKLIFLDNNQKISQKMGKAGRDHVIKFFTWTRHSKQVENALKQVI